MSEPLNDIIKVLSHAAQDPRYDYVFLAIRFERGRHGITEMIIGNRDLPVIQVAHLYQAIARGGVPMGFVHVRLRRQEEKDELQPSLDFGDMFSVYRITALPLPDMRIMDRTYLRSLGAECALALHEAGLIKLSVPE